MSRPIILAVLIVALAGPAGYGLLTLEANNGYTRQVAVGASEPTPMPTPKCEPPTCIQISGEELPTWTPSSIFPIPLADNSVPPAQTR